MHTMTIFFKKVKANKWNQLLFTLMVSLIIGVIAFILPPSANWGWYFAGSNQRYEVSAYQTVVFTIGSSLNPSPTVPEFPITLSLVVVLAVVSLLLVIGKRKLTVGDL
jgi:hypothetical protein